MRCLLVAPSGTPVDLRRSQAAYDAALRGPFEQAGVQVQWARKIASPATTAGTALDEVAGCDFVLAEITRADPAVYFYLGLAHSLEKPTVTVRLAQAVELTELTRFSDFHTAYELSIEGRAELNLRLREILSEIRRVTSLPGLDAEPGEALDWRRLTLEELHRLCHQLLLLQPGLAWVRRTRDWAATALLARGGSDLRGPIGSDAWLVMIGGGLDSGPQVTALAHDIAAFEQRTEGGSALGSGKGQLHLLFVADPTTNGGIDLDAERIGELEDTVRASSSRWPLRLTVHQWDESELTKLVSAHPYLAARYFSRSKKAAAEGIVGFYRDAVASLDEILPRQGAGATPAASTPPEDGSVWQNLAFTATHSIGNSLFPIETYLVALQDLLPANRLEEALGAVEKALENVERAKLQVERFKALSADREPLLQRVDLDAHLEGPLAYARSRGIEVARFGTRSAEVWCDPLLLDEVLDEMVNNAITWTKASPKLSITLREAQPDDLPARLADANDRFVWLRFEDNGAGVAHDNKERIFELFFSTNPQGKGIGLSLCRKYLRGFGGEILEDGTPGTGARFELFLPQPADREAP